MANSTAWQSPQPGKVGGHLFAATSAALSAATTVAIDFLYRQQLF
jgi:hypothetical protein